MRNGRWAIVALGFLIVPIGHANERKGSDAVRAGKAESRPTSATKAKRLNPWEPVDASFNGCSEGLCGTRGRNSRAVLQPGAKVADYTYCVVSGAVFQIKETHHRADVNGEPVYFCCEGCARHFAANRKFVLALRGIR